MRPGPRLPLLMAALAGFALLVPVAHALVYVLPLGAVVLLGAAWLEYRRLTRVVFSLERAPKTVLNLDEDEVIQQRLRHNANEPIHLELRQVFPRIVTPLSGMQRTVCLPGQEWSVDFRVRARERGTEDFAPPVAAATVWGLAERIVTLGGSAEISVLPNMRAVNRLHEQMNAFILRGMGTRSAPRLGKGREFDRLREYSENDDFRDIAWKSSARHQKLIVREFRLDRSQDILICVDRGHRMASRTVTISKVDHAVNAALLMGYICNRMEDRLGILSFGSAVEQGLVQGRGVHHLRQLASFVTGIKAEFIHTDYLALAAHVRRRLRHRSLILIMTDLPEGETAGTLVRAVRTISPPHLPLILVLGDPELEAVGHTLPADHPELCRTLVAREIWSERQHVIRELRRLGALVVETRPQETGVTAVNQYLEVKRRQLL